MEDTTVWFFDRTPLRWCNPRISQSLSRRRITSTSSSSSTIACCNAPLGGNSVPCREVLFKLDCQVSLNSQVAGDRRRRSTQRRYRRPHTSTETGISLMISLITSNQYVQRAASLRGDRLKPISATNNDRTCGYCECAGAGSVIMSYFRRYRSTELRLPQQLRLSLRNSSYMQMFKWVQKGTHGCQGVPIWHLLSQQCNTCKCSLRGK